MRIRFCAAICLLISLTIRGVAAESTPTVPFSLETAGAIVVSVQVNDAGSFKFILDTGSNRSAVTAKLARKLGLAAVARTMAVSSANSETSASNDVVQLTHVTLGAKSAPSLLAAVISDDVMRSLAKDADGLLGQDFLSALNYTLDYRHHRLVWDDETIQKGEVRLPIEMDEGRYLVALPSAKSGRPSVRLVPDSGAEGFVFFEGVATSEFSLAQLPGVDRSAINTVAGGRDVQMRLLQRPRIGTITLMDQPVMVLPAQRAGAPAGDGLLPLRMFSSVTFNGKEHYLTLRP